MHFLICCSVLTFGEAQTYCVRINIAMMTGICSIEKRNTRSEHVLKFTGMAVFILIRRLEERGNT